MSPEDVRVIMTGIQKHWPFNDKKHYLKLNDDGSVTVTFSPRDFALLHMVLHQADYLGRIALLLERNQHMKNWRATKWDWKKIRKLSMSQTISGFRLFATAGGTPEEFEAYATKKTRTHKTKNGSKYEELKDVAKR